MRFVHILSRLTDTPWLITEPALKAITDLLEARISSSADASAEINRKVDQTPVATGCVAVVAVSGVLGKRLSSMETMCGGCDYDSVVSAVNEAARDPNVSTVILAFDTPGGTAVGAVEAYAEILRIRSETGKKVYAFTDTKAASAGYYMASACEKIFCTTSAVLGSIGAILTIEDQSGKLAGEGVRRLTIKSASMKDIGSPDRAPTSDELKELQARVDYLGATFKRDVLASRASVSNDVFEKGLTYFGDEAVAKGLADEVVPSLAALVKKMAATNNPAVASHPRKDSAAPAALAAMPEQKPAVANPAQAFVALLDEAISANSGISAPGFWKQLGDARATLKDESSLPAGMASLVCFYDRVKANVDQTRDPYAAFRAINSLIPLRAAMKVAQGHTPRRRG